jgi:hypothetical protein
LGFLIAVLAGVVLLLGSGLLLSTVGRHRRARTQPLEASAMVAIEGVLGAGLANLAAQAVQLRQRIEDVAERGRELLEVERELGSALRRPLWRQIGDANFGHELARLRRETIAWLADFDARSTSERRLLDQLGIDVEPVRRLVDDAQTHGDDQPTTLVPVRRSDAPSERLQQLGALLKPAAACLRRLELEISGYRDDAYR